MPISTDELLGRLLGALEGELPAAEDLRRRLHAHPELSHAENETAAAVDAELPVPCTVVAGTGRLASVGGPRPGGVAVRAELDGLPLSERTGAPFSARGNVMHACRHDVHMAALGALALAAIVVALHAEVGRRIDPLAGAVLGVGTLEAGSAANLIPAEARARAALRALRPGDRAVLRELVLTVATGVAAAHGCRAHVE